MVHDHDSDSFSTTTTASFSADFAVGALDGKGITASNTDGDEALHAVYGFQIDLTTSFTGEDSLDISIDAGNAQSTDALAEFDLNSGTDGLAVDGVMYTFPLGSATAFVGDNTDGSALFTTACAYGGPSNTLDDCGNVNAGITGGGTAAGASYDFDNGFTAAIGYAGTSALADGTQKGLMTKEGLDAYGVNAAYTGDSYGVSVTYGTVETSTTAEDTWTAVNGYYSFDNGMSISAGYEIGDIGGATDATDEKTSIFVGVQGEVGPGTLGAAMGTKTPTVENTDEQYMYEAFYSYDINDGMTLTPLVYIKENSTVGTPDETGVMVKTSFSF